jgi:hypothetical protein
MPKLLNRHCRFWGPNWETRCHSFEIKPGETVDLGFEAKPRNPHHQFWVQIGRNCPSGFETKPLTNRRPWFWGSTNKIAFLVSLCTIQTAHSVTRPLDRPATGYLTFVIIISPLHQVSYSYHDPRRCLSCHTYHLHTTRQGNTILHTNR